MSQYRTGTITLTNGSNVVTGVGTSWLSQATPNDLLVRTGEGVVYTIAGVSSDTSLTLTANYGGTTGAGLAYVIHRDFIPGGIPLMQRGDVEAADIYNYAINKITTSLSARVNHLPDVSYIDGFVGVDDQVLALVGWHPGTVLGGRTLVYDVAGLKSDHDGLSVFSPTVPWTLTTANYLAGVGETDPAGIGVWRCISVNGSGGECAEAFTP